MAATWNPRTIWAGALLLVACVLAAALIAIAERQFDSMARQNAQTILAQQVREGRDRFIESIAPPGILADILSRQAHAPDERSSSGQVALVRRLVSVMQANHAISSVQITYDDGYYLQLVALRRLEQREALKNIPDATQFASRSSQQTGAGGKRDEHWVFYGDSGNVLAERDEQAGGFEQSMPWFSGSGGPAKRVFSMQHGYTPTSPATLTSAKRLTTEQGVVAASMDLSEFRQLFSLRIASPAGGMALVDVQDRLVAWGHGAQARPGSRLQPLMQLADTSDPALRGLASWHVDGPDVSTRIADIDGQPHVLAQTAAPVSPIDRYRVVAYAPLSDFTEGKTDALHRMLAAAVAIGLLGLGAAWLLARRAAR